MDCLHSFRTDNALKKHERLCGNNDYCHVDMSTENNSTLKYNHGEKSCQINPNDSYTEKKAMHEPCGYSLDLVSSFDSTQFL